jgi:general secretion pathway protein B
MSYILDALRKADAQREGNPARGIHAQAAAPASATSGPARGTVQWMWAAAAVVILAAAAWLWARGDDRPAPQAVAPAPDVVVVVPPRAPVPAPAVFPAAPPVAVVEAPEVRRPAPVAAVEKPAAPVAVAPVQAVPVQPPASERTYSIAELPQDVQQALPKFAISGGVYSENVAQRMLVVNGQVFNEGSEIAPGVVLEQMRPKAAWLKFRGLRISHPY